MIRPEQIDLGRASAKGVVDFKRRTRYRRGLLAIRPNDGFAVRGAVMRALADKG